MTEKEELKKDQPAFVAEPLTSQQQPHAQFVATQRPRGRRPSGPGVRRYVPPPPVPRTQSGGTRPDSANPQAKQDAPRSGGQRKSRSRARFSEPRAKISTQRYLPPTPIHEGKIGTPKELVTQFAQEDNTLKIIALGGLGEIGKNMYVLEYKDDIVVIDAGIMFPEDNMPGIDFVIPNTKYLEDRKDRIRGLILTHGHQDHVGAVPYLQQRLGNPDIYTAQLTRGIVLKRHTEFPNAPKLNIHNVKSGDVVKLGDYFEIEFFHMNHNIPDDLGVLARTPVGNVIHTADFKFDANPVNDVPVNFDVLRKFGDEGVLALLCDSTDAETVGHSISEATIYENLEVIFKEATGTMFVGTFSSMINRIQQLIQLSEKYGRKVIFDGYSLKSNIEIAKELGYIKMHKGTQISMDQIDNYPREKVTVIATGAQGEENASLMRIVNREHRHVVLKKGDTVIFSSSVVPGNERSVQRLKDMLYRTGLKVFHYKMMDIHAGGHARQEDLKEIIELLRPKFLMPIHGQYSMMITLGKIGQEKGIPEENVIVADNGQIIHFTPDQWWIDKQTAPSNFVMVDGLGIGDIGNVVLRDRQVLAEDGMFVIIALVDPRTGQVNRSPDIISRGFVYLKEQKELLAQVRKQVRRIIESDKARPMNVQYLKDQIRDEVGRFLFQKTERRPMVLPVIIET